MNAIQVGLSFVFAVCITGLRAHPICWGLYPFFLANNGEEFWFLSLGILVRESFGCVYQGSED